MTKPVIAPVLPAETPAVFRNWPEMPEGAALALLHLILEQDRSLTSRTSNQPVAVFILDLYGQCLEATNGDRKSLGRGPWHAEREGLQ